MTGYTASLLCISFGLIFSVWIQCRRSRKISSRQVEKMESPMSRAIQTTVGYAGGIYITLVMLASFLQIEVPEKIFLGDTLCVEPLAFLAVMLTIIQPFVLIIWDHLPKKDKE